MAVPKKKMSRRRTRQRKAAWKVSRPTMSTCPLTGSKKSGEPTQPRIPPDALSRTTAAACRWVRGSSNTS